MFHHLFTHHSQLIINFIIKSTDPKIVLSTLAVNMKSHEAPFAVNCL